MPGGEALVTFHVLPDEQPELIENAAFIGVWARSGYQNLQNAVCKQCADGDAEEHCRAEAAGFLKQHQGNGQQNENYTVMPEEGDELKKRSEKISRP